MSYGILKIGSREPVDFFETLEQAQLKLLAYYGIGHEIKRVAFFSIDKPSKLSSTISNPKTIATTINYALNEHVLICGEPQIGKSEVKLEIILEVLNRKFPVILLFRNFNTDYAQFIRRIDEFNEKQRSQGLATIPEPQDILFQQDRLAEILKEPNLILGLANPATITIIDDCLCNNPMLKNKVLLILDEADLVSFELNKDLLTKTEEKLNKLFPNLYMVVSVTGTPGSILLSDKITQVYALDRPGNYYGLDRIHHVPVEPKRSPEKSKQYDPELDSENLKNIMDEIFHLPFATLLILPSRLTDEHKDAIIYLSQIYSNSTKDAVYMELNDKSVKIYNKYGKLIDTIFGKCKGEKVGTIDKALQKYIDTTHIVIVSGVLAGRGISFVSSDYKRHLTHQYIAGSPAMHLETGLQCIRLLGKYNDSPELTLYCSKELFTELTNQQKDMSKIIELAKIAKNNRGSMPAVMELLHTYKRNWLGDRKEKGVAYAKTRNTIDYDLYIDEYNRERDKDKFWFETILTNTARSFAKSILAGSWPGGDNQKNKIENSENKERVIYMNPLSDFTPEGIQKYLDSHSYIKDKTRKALLGSGNRFLADVKLLYEKYPHYEGKILRRRKVTKTPCDQLVKREFDNN